MSVPASPSEMQAEIMDRLISKKTEVRSDTKAIQKFCKFLGGPIETLFKDRFHHEASLADETVSRTAIADFAQSTSNNELLALVKDRNETLRFILRYDPANVALLSRLLFGGDLDSAAPDSTAPFTISELGIVHLFSQMVAKVVFKAMDMKSGPIAVTSVADLDIDDLPGLEGLFCSFRIEAGASTFDLKMVVPATWATGDDEVSDDVVFSSTRANNTEFMLSGVAATVQLAAQSKTLKQVGNLRVGDCIPLLSKSNLAANLVVRDKKVLAGQLGRANGVYCFKVTGSVKTDHKTTSTIR